jgi:hypothetical protein
MMRKQALSLALRGAVVALASVSAGCLQPIGNLDNGPLNSTFAVSDFYTPSGYMGDGEYFGKLTGQVNQGCKEPRPVGHKGNCYVFTYYPNDNNMDPWAGVFWVYPANNWGSSAGHAIDSQVFQQIRFSVAYNGPNPYTFNQAPQFLNGLAGSINPNGNFDPAMDKPYLPPGSIDHVDALAATTAAQMGLDVTPDFKQFHIPLTDLTKSSLCWSTGQTAFAPNCAPKKDANGNPVLDANGQPIELANDLIAAFGWSVHYPSDQVKCADNEVPCPTSKYVNPGPVTLYFDDIVWDTEPAPATP